MMMDPRRRCGFCAPADFCTGGAIAMMDAGRRCIASALALALAVLWAHGGRGPAVAAEAARMDAGAEAAEARPETGAGVKVEKGVCIARPRDTGEALVNPMMGWTFHHYSNIIANYGSRLDPSDTLDDFPGLSTTYLRLPWAFIEAEEGELDWSIVDAPAQRWFDKGKRIALRFSCSESWLRYATPKWVEAAGAKGYNFTPGRIDEKGPFWEPDYADPVFLAKLEKFLAAAAARYDGHPRVDFIDVGSFGVWGEGHTFSSTGLRYPEAVLRKHIDLHARLFPRSLLSINDDFAFYSDDAKGLDILKYPGRATIDHAYAKGMTLRDDSILVQPPPRSYFSAEMAGPVWPRLPVILECQHYGSAKKGGAWGDGSFYLKAVEEYHASYAAIHWWPREFLGEQRDLIDRINRRLGYRLQLREIRWPARIARDERFTVAMEWRNAGVAPCYPGGHPAITLKDDKGGIVAVFVDERSDMRALEVGPPDAAPTATFAAEHGCARNQPAGRFGVFVSVGDRLGTPRIGLPLAGGDGHRRYRIGEIEVIGDRASGS
ncbi:MAG: DUF4832 domain-containing protein [Planctomycetes bacterium]|nr:DUF4832 domain-containing protein [Planctomycetota bacterium]